MVVGVGIEPTNTVSSSHCIKNLLYVSMVGTMGVEPTIIGYKPSATKPFHLCPHIMGKLPYIGARCPIRTASHVPKTRVLPLHHTPHIAVVEISCHYSTDYTFSVNLAYPLVTTGLSSYLFDQHDYVASFVGGNF